ncbi:E3 ubiquitin-protein ligase RHA2A-like [Bidens hawaiensis]|uniref:E3 ubiquitin-protein ligase RHA2A-like n=1 Tax=Bidens hawaiensis TaxID=980011 RepID=UPI004049BC5E
MGIQFLYLAIKIPHVITTTIVSNMISYLLSLMLGAISYIGLFKSPPDPDDYPSSSGNYILILDGSSPSLLPVPVHVVTASIKDKVNVVSYSEFACRCGGGENPVCTVCMECVDDCHMIRELVNCKHVFHQECLDKWLDVGQVNCPLCRSMLLPPKKLLSSVPGTTTTDVNPVT